VRGSGHRSPVAGAVPVSGIPTRALNRDPARSRTRAPRARCARKVSLTKQHLNVNADLRTVKSLFAGLTSKWTRCTTACCDDRLAPGSCVAESRTPRRLAAGFTRRTAPASRGSLGCLPGRTRQPSGAGKHRQRLGDRDVDQHQLSALTKVIWFDGSGWCILAKRLERGSFQLPKVSGDEVQVAIDGAAFASLLAGIDYTISRDGWYRRAAAR
jgi:hypothetical protein